MIVALDTDVLVSWAMQGAPRHGVARAFVQSETAAKNSLGLVPQVLYEFVHICTDGRRFDQPLPMDQALRLARDLWDSQEVTRITPGLAALSRAFDLLEAHHLGRKRILDTVLATTLEQAEVRRLATFNGADYRIFPFLEVVEPE
jgi:predicted nucleic acid-binding protein